MSPRRGVRLELTELAIGDIAEIADDSAKQWGRKASEKYLDELEAGLRRLREQPALLTCLPDLDSSLRYYRVRQHLLICDFRPGTIVVLTVIHASMDLPSRLCELQPRLADEVEMLHRQMRISRGSN
jgi:plasmid stabilization system protein ParE